MMEERRIWRGCQTVEGRCTLAASARGAVGVLAAVVLTATCSGAENAELTPAQTRQLYTQSRQRADELVKAEKYDAAIAVAEDFLRKFPGSGMSAGSRREPRGMAVLVEGILSRNLKDPAKRLDVYRRAYEEFEAATDYYCLGAAGIIRGYLWGHGGMERDAAKAAAVAKEVIDKLEDRLSRDYYLGFNVYMLRTIALRYAEGGEAALDFAKEAALACPAMLSNKDFLRAIADAARVAKDPEQTLPAAKLAYVLCDFKEDDINRATEIVSTALTAAQGPGAALQFAKSQENPEVESPLKDVELVSLGDTDELLKAVADGNRDAKISVLLATGKTAEALTEATEQMRFAAGAAPTYLAAALRNLARCFKAHDLNLIRANRFLEYHRTGEGRIRCRRWRGSWGWGRTARGSEGEAGSQVCGSPRDSEVSGVRTSGARPLRQSAQEIRHFHAESRRRANPAHTRIPS